jgi:uncharacterized protein (DUF2141 family)
MNFRMPLLVAMAIASLASFQAAAADGLKLSNKWRIEVSEGANSDGNIVFRVTPDQGAPTDVTVAIKDGRSENNVARAIVAGLKAGLDKKVYKVERDDGEDVLVKKRKGPNFELKLVESTVKSVRINVEKE